MENAIVLHNQHWQNRQYNIAISRDLLSNLLKFKNSGLIQIITGLRRSGKSSLLKLYINDLLKTENPKSILFINFDDPNYSDIYKSPEKIYDIIDTAEKITQVRIEYLFFDEIQSVVGWEKYIKSVYDAERFKKICITGSNSQLLLGDYATLLSGRYISNNMYPLSINEYLTHFDLSSSIEKIQHRAKLLSKVDSFWGFGSFPEVVLQESDHIKHEILTNYYNSIIIKDCVVNKGIRDSKSFKELAFYIFNNLTTQFSYNSLAKATGINDVSIKEYINAMQEAYMIYEIHNFSFKIKTQIKSRRKLYAIDNGLINATSLKFSENKGRMLENTVFGELLKLGFSKIFFYNESKECDFIIKKHDELIAIQVTYELNNFNRDREINGLLFAQKKIGISEGYIITYSQQETINDNISVIPIYDMIEYLSLR